MAFIAPAAFFTLVPVASKINVTLRFSFFDFFFFHFKPFRTLGTGRYPEYFQVS